MAGVHAVSGALVDRLDRAGFGLLLAAGAVGGIGGGLLAERVIELVGRGDAVFVSSLLAAAAIAGMAVTSSALVAGALLALASSASILGNVVAAALLGRAALMSVLSSRRIEEVRARA